MAHGSQSTCAGGIATSRSRDSKTHWAVVAQNANGASYFFIVELYAADGGELVFERIRKEYKSTTASSCKENWISKIFTNVVVGTAEVEWVQSFACRLHKDYS